VSKLKIEAFKNGIGCCFAGKIKMGPSNGGWDARVRRVLFVSDISKKKALRFRMGQGDFVLKIGQNGAKNVQF